MNEFIENEHKFKNLLWNLNDFCLYIFKRPSSLNFILILNMSIYFNNQFDVKLLKV